MSRTGSSSLDGWLRRLEGLSSAEIVMGLERVAEVLDRLEIALPRRVLHVAGTNGKGSTVAMLEALLRNTHDRLGCYTSPHVIRYNERIRVAGQAAEDAPILAAFERIEAARGDVPLTYFEFGTLAALAVFESLEVDCAILEVGMGGRLDAVNAVEAEASIITNIALDHCDWLGNDVESIGYEKAGIMRPAKPVVFGARDMPASVEGHAATLGAVLIAAGRDYDWSVEGDGRWSWRGRDRTLESLARPSLAGEFQLANAAAVLALLEAIGLETLLDPQTVERSLGSVALTGRMQRLEADGEWLFDVAHNPAAARALADTLGRDSFSGSTVTVIGILDDKDAEGIVSAVDDITDHWIAVDADSSHAIPAAELGRRIANACNKPVAIADSIEEAVRVAREIAADDDRVLVTGSFYVVGPALSALGL